MFLIRVSIIILLVIIELIYFKVADSFNIVDNPNQRSSHTKVTLRGGGIIFMFSVWLYAIFYGFNYPWFLSGLTAISIISFIDDVHSVPNKYRLIVHFVSMLLMFVDLGIANVESWWMLIIALVICVGIINAFNFMDGINGITGGYSLAVLLPLMYINYQKPFIDMNLLVVTSLGLIVFCFFNFRKKAKCFAGDVGAVSIAFVILFALGKLILETKDLSYLVFLCVYGVDVVLTIVHRIMLHENLGQAHRKHLYQLMANELNKSHVGVSSLYMFIQLIISFGYILLPINHWITFVTVCMILSFIYVCFMNRYYHLHEEYLKYNN